MDDKKDKNKPEKPKIALAGLASVLAQKRRKILSSFEIVKTIQRTHGNEVLRVWQYLQHWNHLKYNTISDANSRKHYISHVKVYISKNLAHTSR